MASVPAFAQGRCPLRIAPLRQWAWKAEQLSTFTFLMARYGAVVRASLMLADTAYARAQLRLACSFDDAQLQALAVEMLSAFSGELATTAGPAQWATSPTM